MRINAFLSDPPGASAKIEEDFATIFKCLADGEKVLVHCVHGKHRSLGERTSHDKYVRQCGTPSALRSANFRNRGGRCEARDQRAGGPGEAGRRVMRSPAFFQILFFVRTAAARLHVRT